MPKLLPFYLFSLLLSPTVWAASYTDPQSKVHFTLPAGWKVRAGKQEGQRLLRVLPPKADQRERAAIEVVIQRRKPKRADTLPRLTQKFRHAEGSREAANFVRSNSHTGRLITEYRDGRLVANGLWIVRHNLHVVQLAGKQPLAEARCTANASEFKTYRRQMESICLSLEISK
ncbi:hypothetical protein HZU77_009785 [Neisseriaceae bacterium TC5R-5]|nr:hypothetical protein [Neisseriaceae bacterium TC5R-5]